MAISSVAVLTATSGRAQLGRCVGSVFTQTIPCRHYLMTDAGVMSAKEYGLLRARYPNCSFSFWDAPGGGRGLEGRRLYAAASGLIDEDVILMLNDDDWFDNDHVESLVAILNQGKDWAFSLRKIYDRQGNFLFNDDCEALGQWPVWNAPSYKPEYLVEHSAFALTRDTFRTFGAMFNYPGYGVDRLFTAALREHMPNFGCSRRHTLCYSLGGNPDSVQAEFFEAGNAVMKDRYPEGFPWREQVRP